MTIKAAKFPISETGDSSLIRPRFNPGQFLQDDDLTRAVDYTRELVRLMFRTMLGCGVMCGFRVTAVAEGRRLRIDVTRGVALTCDGEVVEMPEDRTIEIDPTCGPPVPLKIWVAVCAGEKGCAPRETHCSENEDDPKMAPTRIWEGYTLKLLAEPPVGACSCEGVPQGASCYDDHVAGRCACECGCPCVVLATVAHVFQQDQMFEINVDHRVRRFIRPILLADPAVEVAAPPPPPGPPPPPPSSPPPPSRGGVRGTDAVTGTVTGTAVPTDRVVEN